MIYFWLLVAFSLLIISLLAPLLEIAVLSFLPDGFFIKKKKYSEIIKSTEDAEKGIGATHRNPLALEGPLLTTSTSRNITTQYAMMKESVSQFPDKKAVGWREVDLKTGKAGSFQWLSYSQFYQRSKDFGAGLMHLNLIPKVDSMRMLGMYVQNCPEWNIAETGLFMFSGVTVPLYDTLGAEAVEYILKHTGVPTVVCGPKQLENILKSNTEVKNIIAIGNFTAELMGKAAEKGLKVYTFGAIEAEGQGKDIPHEIPSAEDPFTFCYTSGTTGDPKGALLSHANLISEVTTAVMSGSGASPGDRYLSYLPIAHVLERTSQAVLFNGGGCVGYYQGDTLKIVEDINELKPTMFVSVPRLLNRMYDKVMGNAQKHPVTRILFSTALLAKKLRMRKMGTARHFFWDRLVFNKVAPKIGLGECWLVVSGSAPLASHVLEFLRVVLPARVVEGYGQTETCAAAALQDKDSMELGDVGGPVVACEIRLESIPDMGYNITDTIHGEDKANNVQGIPCDGRGEICVRGKNIFMNYYKDKLKTDEAVDSEGWCHTGDIGIWLKSGALKIVDRKKNIFKLSQGEYVAPEKLENVYGESLLVGQVFVYGDSFQAVLVAIVVPDVDGLKAWCSENGVDASDKVAICQNQDLKKAIIADITKVAKAAKLHGFEIVKAIHLSMEPFTYENGLLTTTFKLKRDVAKKTFQKELDAMYASLGGVAGQHVKQN